MKDARSLHFILKNNKKPPNPHFLKNYVHVYIYLRAEEFQFPRVGVAGHLGKLLMEVL